MNTLFLVLLTVAELALVALVLLFFLRLRRSEQILSTLQANQDDLLERMLRNAELEQEMVATFAQRQEQMVHLNALMEERIAVLRRLLEQAEGISRSPHFLREVILNCRKKGQSAEQIAKTTGLARDEIELILNRE
jgi:DNA polymerase III psi subunit